MEICIKESKKDYQIKLHSWDCSKFFVSKLVKCQQVKHNMNFISTLDIKGQVHQKMICTPFNDMNYHVVLGQEYKPFGVWAQNAKCKEKIHHVSGVCFIPLTLRWISYMWDLPLCERRDTCTRCMVYLLKYKIAID